MINKIYDPQYETNIPHFNRKIVEKWVIDNDIEKIKHWFKNGRPNARLANEAIHFSIYQDNPTIIDLVYKSNWISKEKILTYTLSKSENSIYPSKNVKDYFSQIRKWSTDKIFEEITNKSFKDKVVKELIYLMSKTSSYDDANNYGIDYSIKSVSDDVSLLSKYLYSNLEKLEFLYDKYSEDKKESIYNTRQSALYYLESIVFLIKNKACVDDNLFRSFTHYSGKNDFDFLTPFFQEILLLENISIGDHKSLGLFMTELALWKHYEFISENNFISMLKLFIRSGIKEKLTIKRKDVKDDYNKKGILSDYFKIRHGVVGGITIGKSYRNNIRMNQVIFYDNYSFKDGEDNEKINIDVREYIFINQNNEFNKPVKVSKEEIEKSIEKYENLKL